MWTKAQLPNKATTTKRKQLLHEQLLPNKAAAINEGQTMQQKQTNVQTHNNHTSNTPAWINKKNNKRLMIKS